MARVLFLPQKRAEVSNEKESIAAIAERAGIALTATCGGKGICGRCRVVVEAAAGRLPEPSERERETLGRLLDEGYRLACETFPEFDATIRIPEESLSGRQVILTSGTNHPYPARLRPILDTYYLEVPPPSIEKPTADRERLLAALSSTYGMKSVTLDPFVLAKLPAALRSESKGLTAVIRGGHEIIDLCPGNRESRVGMAFDVGTTTVVGYLMDLGSGERLAVKSALNPQIQLGEDVISRISFCRNEADGSEKLRTGVVQCLNRLMEEAAVEAGMKADAIAEVTAVGNTAMHHLLLGMDTGYLAMAPYPPVLSDAQDFKARDLGLKAGPSAYVHLPPLKAGFVGSDTVACVLATRIHRSRIPTLLIDLGTNGEIVAGSRDRLICCSTAAGPAFEGGHIECGMRASEGAIERVMIDPSTLDVQVKTVGGARPVGLCGSGIISAAAGMIRAGIIQARGNFNKRIRSPRLRVGKDGLEFVLVPASKAGIDRDIVMSQRDVAQLQMAKAAVRAGAALLTEILNGEPVRRVLLAGAGGNYMDPLDARTIDLLPDCREARVVGVGNAALHGACLALLDRRSRREAERISERMEYCELSAMERFQDLFVSGMLFTQAADYEDTF